MKENQIVIEHQSRFGFEKTVEMLVADAEKREWKVPAVHDLQQSWQNREKMSDRLRSLKFVNQSIQDRCLNSMMNGLSQ